MKYKVSELRDADYREVDITEFFPSATEKVIVKVKRLTEKLRRDVLALVMRGQSMRGQGGEMTFTDTGFLQKAREIELLNGVVIDESFPFEEWTMKLIDEIDSKNPLVIKRIHEAIQEFNGPLALGSEEK